MAIDKSPGLRPAAGRADGYIVSAKIVLIFFLLYLFILSITLLGAAFKLFGADFARAIFQTTSNPLVGLMIGILSTAIIQSSSTTTSIIVGLVAAGSTTGTGLTFEAAIPMVMGANIGTSVTNTIVSLGHIARGDEFRRAFAGSMVHDLFNVCAVIVLFPLQVYYNIIGISAKAVESVFVGFGGLKFSSPLAAITKPVAHEIVHLTGDSAWLSVIISFVLLIVALRYIVKVLKSLVLSRVEKFFQRYVFRTPALGFLLGVVLTVLVQSSSITSSMIVPLMGAGVITIHQAFPYMLGANVGTTITAFLASFVTGSEDAVSVAFAHLLFNTYGILIFWPLKAIPIGIAEKLGEWTTKSKIIPIIYIVIVFFIVPGIIIYLLG
jgi:sodium-dependent phosphate cotransporter